MILTLDQLNKISNLYCLECIFACKCLINVKTHKPYKHGLNVINVRSLDGEVEIYIDMYVCYMTRSNITDMNIF